jgi:hypothetical protein
MTEGGRPWDQGLRKFGGKVASLKTSIDGQTTGIGVEGRRGHWPDEEHEQRQNTPFPGASVDPVVLTQCGSSKACGHA